MRACLLAFALVAAGCFEVPVRDFDIHPPVMPPVQRTDAATPSDAATPLDAGPDAGGCVCAPGVSVACEHLCPAVQQVALGGGTACARLESGRVRCWGRRLGDTFMPPRSRAEVVDGLIDATDIDCGVFHCCARRASGRVSCWGSDSRGQLGGGGDRIEARTVPGLFATQVAAGERFSCGLQGNGDVLCWGANDRGQLGGGVPSRAGEAVKVVSAESFEAVTAGANHACGLARGRALCWGDDSSGQRSTGGPGVTDLGVDSVTRIHAGYRHTCVEHVDRTVTCFGNDFPPPYPSPAELSGPASAFASGEYASCIVLDDGATRCGGWWRHYSDFVPQVDLSPTATVTAPVSIGDANACFVRDGRVWCWGGADQGILGGAYRPTRLPYVARSGARSVVTGARHSCAIDDQSEVTCWGDDNWGQHGVGALSLAGTPTQAVAVSDVAELSAGHLFSCARSVAGAVWCWGRNDVSQASGRATRHQIGVARVANLTAIAIAAGFDTACAVTDVGAVRCWGKNDDDVTGVAGPASRPDPIEVPSVTAATDVCVGIDHACAVVASGHVWCWGAAVNGKLGGAPENVAYPPTQVPTVTEAVQVECGLQHTCARLSTGSVMCWGRNQEAELGIGSKGGTRGPIAVVDITDATDLAIGYEHSCVVRASGGVSCWGLDTGRGRLGTGASRHIVFVRPQVVLDVERAVSIDAGRDSTCAVRDDGDTVCWGDNSFGQLDGRTPITFAPIEVMLE